MEFGIASRPEVIGGLPSGQILGGPGAARGGATTPVPGDDPGSSEGQRGVAHRRLTNLVEGFVHVVLLWLRPQML